LAQTKEKAMGTLLFAVLICFSIAYLTSLEPSSIGATELIEVMAFWGVMFLILLIVVAVKA
jgi:hypothetical protein